MKDVSIEAYHKIKKKLDEAGVSLVAVSKTKPNSAIMGLYNEGQLIFGENRVQELVKKYNELPKDIEWHMIGHLQRNKVKYIAPFVHMIESVDSFKLIREINKEAEKAQRIIPCLLQFYIATEDSKFGFDIEEANEMLRQSKKDFTNIEISGVMGMASFTADEDQLKEEFRDLKNIFQTLKDGYFSKDPKFKYISMGMSGDYKVAISSGSNMVRLGSVLFGSRS